MSVHAERSETIIEGYRRPDGQAGVRNHVAIIYTVECSKIVAQQIGRHFDGVQVFGRRTGCGWSEPMFSKLVALGRHPNVAAVLVVGLGCEYIEATRVAATIAESGKPVRSLVITETGGTIASVQKGRAIVADLLEAADQAPRVSLSIGDLVVAMDCAGSDATSGLAANPAVGVAADLLVQAGATVYFFNIHSELMGMADILAARAVDESVADAIRQVAPPGEKGRPSFGNVQGGLTTRREKAAGALAKSGSSPIMGVVQSFQRPTRPGLYLEVPVEGSHEGLSDPQCAMQMAACGAHVVVETTGVGTVTGGVVSPVIKVCANPKTVSLLSDDMDIDASGIVRGEQSIREVGEMIYRRIVAVAGGEQARTEILGHVED